MRYKPSAKNIADFQELISCEEVRICLCSSALSEYTRGFEKLIGRFVINSMPTIQDYCHFYATEVCVGANWIYLGEYYVFWSKFCWINYWCWELILKSWLFMIIPCKFMAYLIQMLPQKYYHTSMILIWNDFQWNKVCETARLLILAVSIIVLVFMVWNIFRINKNQLYMYLFT